MADPTLSISKQHIYSADRLISFSDALFSVIATFSIVPLKFNRELVLGEGGYKDFDLEDYLLTQWPRYLIYFYSFALVADMWFIHCGVFSIVENVDDWIIWLNLLLLFIVSFVPFATGLISGYANSLTSEHIAISICAVIILLFSINLIIIMAYSFYRQSLFHSHLVNNRNIRAIKIAIYISLSIQPLIALLAFGFSFLTNDVSWLSLLLFYSILPLSLLAKFGFYITFKCTHFLERIPTVYINRIANKSRAEAFSDGVFGLVATLIILDLTTNNIPDENYMNMHHESLAEALKNQRFVFLSYVTTFLVTGLLWFVQYSMFHFIKSHTLALSITNICISFLIGGIPFASELLSVFSDEDYPEQVYLAPKRILCVRVFCVLVSLAGLFQLLFWCVAHHQKKYCMTDEIEGKGAETLMFMKIMVIPITGLAIYGGTFSEIFMDYHIHTVLGFVALTMFLLLKPAMRLLAKCCGGRRPKKKTSSIQIKPPSPVPSDRSEGSPLLDNRSPVMGVGMHSQKATKDVFV